MKRLTEAARHISRGEFTHTVDIAGEDEFEVEKGVILEEIAMGDYAALPIYYYVSKNVVAPNVHGFVDNAKDIHRTRWLSLDE